jgi:hypothetical protein
MCAISALPICRSDGIGARIAEHLELVAAGMAVFDLERLNADVRAAVSRGEMELVRPAGSVFEYHRLEVGMIEVDASDARVEAARADESHPFRRDAQMDRVVAGHGVPAVFAALHEHVRVHAAEQSNGDAKGQLLMMASRRTKNWRP